MCIVGTLENQGYHLENEHRLP